MRSREAIRWEKKLKGVFDEIDHELEAEYHAQWPLHPSRPKQGATANPEMDGLLNIGATFSIGCGSRYGPGYTVEIRLSTLHRISEKLRAKMKRQVLQALERKLPQAFPGKNLQVVEENGAIRIHGDLGLD